MQAHAHHEATAGDDVQGCLRVVGADHLVGVQGAGGLVVLLGHQAQGDHVTALLAQAGHRLFQRAEGLRHVAARGNDDRVGVAHQFRRGFQQQGRVAAQFPMNAHAPQGVQAAPVTHDDLHA